MSHKKFGPDQFSRFDVFGYKQTDRHQDTQTDREEPKYVYDELHCLRFFSFKVWLRKYMKTLYLCL